MARLIFFSFIFYFLFSSTSSFSQRYELNKKDTSEIQWELGKKFYVIKVEKGETLYSLSKRFNVTQDELLLVNPQLKEGLKLKMKLMIPASSHATVPSKEKAEEKKPVKKLYYVSLLLPIKIWKSLLPDSLRTDSTDDGRNNESLTQLEFYEGVEHAVDTLASKDCKFHLSVFDTENDLPRLKTLLKDTLLRSSDYIIAAGNTDIIKELNLYSIEHHISLVTFSLNASEVLKNNAEAYAFTPSSSVQCFETGKFFATKYKGANAMVIKSAVAKENERAKAFADGWNSEVEKSGDQKVKSADYSTEDFKKVIAQLAKGKNNLLFIPSSNEDFVNSLVTQLHDTINTYQFTVVGIPTWQYFESMDPQVLEKLNAHLFTASGIDYGASKVMAFRKYFRDNYITEPEESAYQGYDAMMFVGERCKQHGKKENEKHFTGLFSEYDFDFENGTNENHKIHILRYKDYKLVEVK